MFFLANFPGLRWSTILFPMTRFPDDPIFQITRSPDHRITRSQALVAAWLRCVLCGKPLNFSSTRVNPIFRAIVGKVVILSVFLSITNLGFLVFCEDFSTLPFDVHRFHPLVNH